MGLALYVEFRALRGVLAHTHSTQKRIALVEGGRYRALKQSTGERAGRRTAYEDRISEYAKAACDKLDAIHALLAPRLATPERSDNDGDVEARLHSEDAPARVAKAAQEIKSRRAAQRELAAVEPRPAEGDEADDKPRTSRLPPAPDFLASVVTACLNTEGDDDKTRVWTAPDAARVRVEAEAGGATRHPRPTPHEALPATVAPPPSAPPSTAPDPAVRAAGLGRPKSARPAPHMPPVKLRSETLAGMSSPLPAPDAGDTSERTSWLGLKQSGGVGLSTRPPAGPAPAVAVPRFAPTMASMPAQSTTPESRRAAPIVSTKEVCKRCERSGVVREPGGAIVQCPACLGYGLVDTTASLVPEAS